MIKTIDTTNITDEMIAIYYQTAWSPSRLLQKAMEAAPEVASTPDESYLRGYADAFKSKSNFASLTIIPMPEAQK